MHINEFKDSLKKLTDINAIAEMRNILSPLTEEWIAVEGRLRELLHNKYADEKVLVVPSAKLQNMLTSELSYTPILSVELEVKVIKLLEENAVFMPRYEVEFNPLYKQIIPYVAAVKDGKVFTMTRIGVEGDSRLVGNTSIGIGGHINPVDVTEGESVILKGLRRELDEEVKVNGISDLKLRGYIYDSSNNVGLDHLGLVYTCMPWDDMIEVKEKDKLVGEMADIKSLDTAKMENWTRLVYENILA